MKTPENKQEKVHKQYTHTNKSNKNIKTVNREKQITYKHTQGTLLTNTHTNKHTNKQTNKDGWGISGYI